MSIAHVAKHAGVSAATVTLVINNSPKVKPATAKAVRESIVALGYAPKRNTHSRFTQPKLSQKTIGRAALVTWGFSESMLQMPVYLDLLSAIEESLRAKQMGMVLFHAAATDKLGINNLKSAVDGLILLGSNLEDFPIALRSLPCVRTMGGIDNDVWYDHVTLRNEKVGSLAAQHLLKCGHRSCVVLAPSNKKGIWEERAQTFCATIKAGGGVAISIVEPALMVPRGDAVNRNRMIAMIDRMLALRPRPTGIFIPADILTLSAYAVLLDRGISLGKDVDVVSCNNEPTVLKALHPCPSVVDIHVKEIGRRSVQQLLWRIEHPQASRTNITIEPELIPSPVATRATR